MKRDVRPVPGLDPQVGLLLAMLDDGTKEWREELGELEVPDEAVVWQPFPQGHSIGAVILHIAEAEAFWLQEVADGRSHLLEELEALLSEEIDQYAVHWPTPPKRPLTWFYEQHDRIREEIRHTIRRLADPEHLGRRGKREYTLRWMLHHVITHEAYHGGQAVLLALQYAHHKRSA
ncbi:MAG: DinB family protein [Candidatus Bipolaricaulia bacterium]